MSARVPAAVRSVLHALLRPFRVPLRRVVAAWLLGVLAFGCLDAGLDVGAARHPAPVVRSAWAAALAASAGVLAPAPRMAAARSAPTGARPVMKTPGAPVPPRERGSAVLHCCLCTYAVVTLVAAPAAPEAELAPPHPRLPAASSDRLPACPTRERLLRPPAVRVA